MVLYEQLLELRRARHPVVLVTLVSSRGSTPRKPGAKMLVFPDGSIRGTIGGGRVEHEVIAAATDAFTEGTPRLLNYQLTSELAMCCGGEMSFFLEPLMPPPPLLVFGCGHVGNALLQAAAPLNFDLFAIDDLPQNLTPELLPESCQRLDSYEPEDLNSLPFDSTTSIVIATRDHSLDQRLLEHCIKREFRYLGIIGSQRKAHMQEERLRVRGISEELITRIHCPIGIDIGAQSPAEIATSICAELISIQRAQDPSQ